MSTQHPCKKGISVQKFLKDKRGHHINPQIYHYLGRIWVSALLWLLCRAHSTEWHLCCQWGCKSFPQRLTRCPQPHTSKWRFLVGLYKWNILASGIWRGIGIVLNNGGIPYFQTKPNGHFKQPHGANMSGSEPTGVPDCISPEMVDIQ